MKNFTEFLSETTRSNYEIYHKSFTSAFEEMVNFVSKNGYEMDEDDVYSSVTTGGASGRARPGVGKTNKFTIRLTKNGNPTKKALQAQVYGMGGTSGSYELNMYIS